MNSCSVPIQVCCFYFCFVFSVFNLVDYIVKKKKKKKQKTAVFQHFGEPCIHCLLPKVYVLVSKMNYFTFGLKSFYCTSVKNVQETVHRK